jgi:2,4-dienoyl-CoA reductase-like NADH-dependent reductase (Old Yellow Enzyme family)
MTVKITRHTRPGEVVVISAEFKARGKKLLRLSAEAFNEKKKLVVTATSKLMPIKKMVSIPEIVVGGINNMDDINDIIKNKKLDFVSMSRPFIVEPGIENKFSDRTQTKSKCIMCNYNIVIAEDKPLKCY